ncbi:hypothetical protein [Parasitella parasitica]|uniref:Methyltransferase domain-containing protein n=1 Tax=Parasitella parasitica TaxID=35722 RepID=A0A0B7MW72_9FUNG|nr:hypothetical protein [Parasitella parasitica]
MTAADIFISSKRHNRLLKLMLNMIHGCGRKRKNHHPFKAVASSPPLVSSKEGSQQSSHLNNTDSGTDNQRMLDVKASRKSLSKAIHDSGVSMSRSTSMASSIEVLSAGNLQDIDRMVSQHYILRTAFDADYSAPILSLSDKQKSNKVVVLDIGCGSGTWTMEMATQFPHAHFIGIDRQPSFPHDIKPKNCSFKLFDISQSIVKLPFMDNSVDYIFQRDLNWDLSESTWLPLVDEFFRILKPGGWIELVEPDIETHSTSPYEDYLINKQGFYHRQQDPFISKRLPSFMAVAGFRRIQSDFQSIPLGWGYQKMCATTTTTTDPQLLRCSEFARAAASHRLDLLKSLQPWFSRENHISKAKYDAYVNHLPEEWYHNKAYVNWHRSTAQKPYDTNSYNAISMTVA